MSPGRTAAASRNERSDKSSAPKAGLAVVAARRPSLRLTTIIVTALAILVLFGLVGFQALIVRHQSRLDDLNAQTEEVTRVNQRLRLDVAQLEAPDRIRTVAIAILGMVEPEENVTYLEPISAEELQPIGSPSGTATEPLGEVSR